MLKQLLYLTLVIFTFTNAVQIYTKQNHQQVLNYWTKERMLNAKDISIIELSKEEVTRQKNLHKYKKSTLSALLGDVLFESTKVQKSQLKRHTTEVPIRQYNYEPYKQAGKLFSVSQGGQGQSCSASSLEKGIIITAGHCISDGKGNMYHSISFCPQYQNGNCPHGRFSVSSVLVFDEYHRRNNMGRDVAFLISVRNNRRVRLDEAVGSYKLAINRQRNNYVKVLGYPGNFRNGQLMIQSIGFQSQGHSFYEPATTKVPSHMTQGASGGPTTLRVAGGTGVNGVSSYITSSDPGHLFIPYFDTPVENYYKAALRSAVN